MAKKVQLTKNQRRRLKKKQQKKAAREAKEKATKSGSASAENDAKLANSQPPPPPEPKELVPKVEIEYVFDQNFRDSIQKAFSEDAVESMMKRFKTPDQMFNPEPEEDPKAKEKEASKAAVAKAIEEAKKEAQPVVLSRRKKKLMNRLSVAELKQLVKRPDVVEVHDVTSADPRLLVYLKSYRNSVPVPRHWCHKRKYLQGKRGIEKPPFKLPDFIEATGISKIRATVQEKDDGKSLRQRARERMNAKMGKIDIDYQVLYTAFFKNQTKPPMTIHGDVYYESKEFETKLREKRPGALSEDMKAALGMPEGAPPPWLINMQRYGPPPSYPKLKIKGLNCPIPQGASFGYHPGGWGKPPVDDMGRPIYGDVFGTSGEAAVEEEEKGPEHRMHWGELEEVEEEEEDEEDEDQEDDATDVDDMTGVETPLDETGISSVTSGLETPDTIELRKGTRSLSSMGTDTPSTPQLYKILEQQQAGVGGAIYGSDKRYVMPSASSGTGAGAKAAGVAGSDVAIALDPSELENLDSDKLQAKYDQAKAAQAPAASRKRKSRFGQSAPKKAKDSFKF